MTLVSTTYNVPPDPSFPDVHSKLLVHNCAEFVLYVTQNAETTLMTHLMTFKATDGSFHMIFGMISAWECFIVDTSDIDVYRNFD